MATLKFFTFLVVASNLVCGSDVVNVIKQVKHCFREEVEPCLVNHAVEAMVDAAGLQSLVNGTEAAQGRSGALSIEDVLEKKLYEELGKVGNQSTGRGKALRTFNKAWKYLIPLLMGVMLKLAAFVPLVLVVLTLIAKTAFMSGKMALLMTGLNLALKYWYPKWSAPEIHHGHTEYSGNFPDTFGQMHMNSMNHLPHSFQSLYAGHGVKPHEKVTSVEYSRMFHR